MGWYLLKRLHQAIPLLLGIVTVTFFMMQLAPGDRLYLFKGEHSPLSSSCVLHTYRQSG